MRVISFGTVNAMINHKVGDRVRVNFPQEPRTHGKGATIHCIRIGGCIDRKKVDSEYMVDIDGIGKYSGIHFIGYEAHELIPLISPFQTFMEKALLPVRFDGSKTTKASAGRTKVQMEAADSMAATAIAATFFRFMMWAPRNVGDTFQENRRSRANRARRDIRRRSSRSFRRSGRCR